MNDTEELASWVKRVPSLLLAEKRRHYAEPWCDWENQSTGCKEPTIYALWMGANEPTPQYVGKTTRLGHRLWQHFSNPNWKPKPEYVSFYESAEFRDPDRLSLAEAFVISALQPHQNSEILKKKRNA